jgi:hypothetical protein
MEHCTFWLDSVPARQAEAREHEGLFEWLIFPTDNEVTQLTHIAANSVRSIRDSTSPADVPAGMDGDKK